MRSKPMPVGLSRDSLVSHPRAQRPAHGRWCWQLCGLVLVLLLLASGCAKRKRGPSVPVSRRPSIAAVMGATEEGVASWYGNPYHGRRTANGEVYDMERMTAAHPSLPFNLWVRVLNLDNGQQTTVRINDRGPFVKGRIIDLSRAAARAVSMLGPGIAKVRITVIPAPVQEPDLSRPSPSGSPTAGGGSGQDPPRRPSAFGDAHAGYAVQFGAFRNYQNAISLRDRVALHLADARVVEASSEPGLWIVLAGTNLSREEAEKIVAALRADFPRIFPVSAH
ncbi:MAG: septal ring lytic transglycosylase RlpA family protein [Bryobacterales bacterium]|nr:septal ring lytic transglycosylase RlpA family protein [Bryobacterales bacterium]